MIAAVTSNQGIDKTFVTAPWKIWVFSAAQKCTNHVHDKCVGLAGAEVIAVLAAVVRAVPSAVDAAARLGRELPMSVTKVFINVHLAHTSGIAIYWRYHAA